MNKKLVFLFDLMILTLIYSCKKKLKPKDVYMPDMYYSQSYEAYSDYEKNKPYIENKGDQVKLFKKNKTTSLHPVKGTVARNPEEILAYEFPQKKIKKDDDSKDPKNNLPPTFLKFNKEDLERGKEMYQIYCAICHGINGAGDGVLVQNEKILGVPSYENREITIGSIYHVIMYGKDSMGSYAYGLNPADRWKVAGYVMKLKENK